MLGVYLMMKTIFLVFSLSVFVLLSECRSSNGRCSYDVILDHRERCDGPSMTLDTADDPSCCRASQIELLQLKLIVNGLTKRVEGIEQNLGLPPQTIDFGSISASNATAREKTLLEAIVKVEAEIKASASSVAQIEAEIRALGASLTEKEEEINTTNTVLSHVTEQSKWDMDKLTKQIANKTRDANDCKRKLGLYAGNVHPHADPDAPANLTYCSFDEKPTACGFIQDQGSGDDADWTVKNGKVDSKTGPKEDHTYGSPKGHYMYLYPRYKATTAQTNHIARMTSLWYDTAQNYCIRFWYNMYGVDVRTLNVYAMTGTGRGYPIWSTSGNQGDAWHLGEISLDSEYTSMPFKIVFEANHNAYLQRSSSSHSSLVLRSGLAVIALDDIYAYNVTCSDLPTCPAGSHHRKQSNSTSCYTFHTKPQNWYQSHLTCHKEGATTHLVSVNSKEEQDYLVEIIKKDAALTAAGSNGWFTSGNDERSEHHFDWTDTGTPYTSHYSDWHTGQPNNVGDDQDCLLMQYADDNYEWGDVDCDEPHPFICEVDLPVI